MVSFVVLDLLICTLWLIKLGGWPRLKRKILPVMLLYFLAVTGNLGGNHWADSFRGPAFVATALAVWFFVELHIRFPIQGPRLPRCRKCGYDLRGNISGICPECGQKMESKCDNHE